MKDGLNSAEALNGETAIGSRGALLKDVVERLIAAPFEKDEVVVAVGGIKPGNRGPGQARVRKLLNLKQIVGLPAREGCENVVFCSKERTVAEDDLPDVRVTGDGQDIFYRGSAGNSGGCDTPDGLDRRLGGTHTHGVWSRFTSAGSAVFAA